MTVKALNIAMESIAPLKSMNNRWTDRNVDDVQDCSTWHKLHSELEIAVLLVTAANGLYRGDIADLIPGTPAECLR